MHLKKVGATNNDVDMEAGSHVDIAGSSNDHEQIGNIGNIENMEAHHQGAALHVDGKDSGTSNHPKRTKSAEHTNKVLLADDNVGRWRELKNKISAVLSYRRKWDEDLDFREKQSSDGGIRDIYSPGCVPGGWRPDGPLRPPPPASLGIRGGVRG